MSNYIRDAPSIYNDGDSISVYNVNWTFAVVVGFMLSDMVASKISKPPQPYPMFG